MVVKREAAKNALAELAARKKVQAEAATDLVPTSSNAFNVVGRIVAQPSDGKKLPGVVVIGAHYDHLGRGGHGSLAPGSKEPHVGADDNASGTAALLEVARALGQKKAELRRDVVFAAFSAEESGVLGSSHFVRAKAEGKKDALAPRDVYAMINFDMVGRMRDNSIQVLGTDSAKEWKALLPEVCDALRVECGLASDGGVGPSDQMSFFLAGAPVLHFFTGTHADYHKPSDTADKVNAAGAAQAAALGASMVTLLSARSEALTYQKNFTGPPTRGDMRSGGASLGTVPDYAGPGAGKSGVLLAGVRPGGPAEKAGIVRGDLVVKIGNRPVNSVEDLMFILGSAKPGQKTTVVVIREGKEKKIDVTFGESHRR
jgi:Zn-dependent M28 family amino/carboxypeptidase